MERKEEEDEDGRGPEAETSGAGDEVSEPWKMKTNEEVGERRDEGVKTCNLERSPEKRKIEECHWKRG